jgi:hypothetical protein
VSARINLVELRDAAEHDGISATTTHIGGIGWHVVLALVEAVEAAADVYRSQSDEAGADPMKALGVALAPFDFEAENGHPGSDA